MQLRHYQEDAVSALFGYWREEAGNPLIDLATGCHAAGTKIMMYDGTTKPVELVAANDNLMGPDSRPRRVLRTVSGREMMYRVTPVKGESFIVNEGHILSLKATNEGKKAARYPNSHRSGGEVVNITLSDYIQKSKSWKHLHKLWRTGVDFDFPANDNLPVPAYIVGAMLGDGSVTHNVGLTNMDPEVISEVCSYAESLGVGVRITQKSGNRAFGIFFPDEEANRSVRNRFVVKLEEAGIWGMVCDRKGIPHPYKTGSRHTRLEVLAGLLDTDGHLCNGTGFDFISKSENLSRDVAFVARSLGLAAYVKSCDKYCQTGGGGTYWRVSISGDVDIIPNRVSRQKARARQQVKNPLVTGFTVEPVGEGDYYGFSLDGDHLYLTEDFTVHHNTGKSMVMATVIKDLVEGWPDMRIMVVTHVAELIEQNFMELVGIWPFAPAGIFSAGLNRRDSHSQIIFAGIQTVWNKVAQIGAVDVILVDECHLIPKNSNTMYGKFLAAMRELNPDLKLVGLTATPFRLDSGRLDEGEDRMFDRVVYTYGIGDGVRDGYLAPLSSKETAMALDVKGVGRLGGDFKQSALQAAVDKLDVTRAAVDEIVAKGANRRSWLCFCSGVEHAQHVAAEIRSRGITCETITGETPKEERRRIIEDFKAYRIRALTNNSVLTTGFNHKGVDLIAALRPTLSASLYLQMMGRGTRVLYAPGMPLETPDQRRAAIAAGPKPSCLVLDFAGLVDKHGPVDMVEPKTPGSGDGDAPIKICPQESKDKNGRLGCGEKVHASARQCPCCQFEFDIDDSPKITSYAADTPIMSIAEPESRIVRKRTFWNHPGKDGKADSVKTVFTVGMSQINKWYAPQAGGRAKADSDRFWDAHRGKRPFPKTALEWLERQGELADTKEIFVRPAGKYWNVEGYTPANDNVPAAANDSGPAKLAAVMADDIPF